MREDIDKVIGRIGYFGSGEYELIDSVDDISARYKSWFAEHVANDVGKYILSNAPGSVSVEVCMGQYEIPRRWPGLILSINDSPVFETYFPKFKVRGPKSIKFAIVMAQYNDPLPGASFSQHFAFCKSGFGIFLEGGAVVTIGFKEKV